MDRNLNEEEAIVQLLETLRSRIEDLIPEPKRNKFAQGELVGYRDCLKMAMAWVRGNEVISEEEYLKLITPKTRKRFKTAEPVNEEESNDQTESGDKISLKASIQKPVSEKVI